MSWGKRPRHVVGPWLVPRGWTVRSSSTTLLYAARPCHMARPDWCHVAVPYSHQALCCRTFHMIAPHGSTRSVPCTLTDRILPYMHILVFARTSCYQTSKWSRCWAMIGAGGQAEQIGVNVLPSVKNCCARPDLIPQPAHCTPGRVIHPVANRLWSSGWSGQRRVGLNSLARIVDSSSGLLTWVV